MPRKLLLIVFCVDWFKLNSAATLDNIIPGSETPGRPAQSHLSIWPCASGPVSFGLCFTGTMWADLAYILELYTSFVFPEVWLSYILDIGGQGAETHCWMHQAVSSVWLKPTRANLNTNPSEGYLEVHRSTTRAEPGSGFLLHEWLGLSEEVTVSIINTTFPSPDVNRQDGCQCLQPQPTSLSLLSLWLAVLAKKAGKGNSCYFQLPQRRWALCWFRSVVFSLGAVILLGEHRTLSQESTIRYLAYQMFMSWLLTVAELWL